MKRLFAICGVALLAYIAEVSHAQAGAHFDQARATQDFSPMPLGFTQNKGQWNDRVLFRAEAGGAVMWFTRDGVYYQFSRRIESPTVGQDPREPDMFGSLFKTAGVGIYEDGEGRNPPRAEGFDVDSDSVELMMVKATFVGASPNPEIVAEGLLDYKCNYFLGSDPGGWRTNVPNFSAITFKDIYPRVDLRFFGDNNGQVTYEFQEASGADLADVRVAYQGAVEVIPGADGRKAVQTRWGVIVDAIDVLHGGAGMISPRPLSNTASYYNSQNQLQAVDQTTSQELQLYYSTYLGGEFVEEGRAITVDDDGNAYITGLTMSPTFPANDAYDLTHNGSLDAYVAKLSPSGALIYSTFLGGDGDDEGYAIAEFNGGRIYVTGSTSSTDFPTQNPYQTHQGSVDVFVTKLNKTGDTLIYSTYLGGTGSESGYGIAVGYGYAYVTGQVFSGDFPTVNPFQTFQGGIDAFVTKLSLSGDSLIYSTYLGGSNHDYGYGIAVDNFDRAYVTGQTISSDFPTLNPFQTYQGPSGSADAFVTKLSSSGATLEYSTYLGGDHVDRGRAIALDGSAVVTGETLSSDFPTKSPYQNDQGVADAFVTKLSRNGDSLIYSTYLGGGGSDYGYGIAVGAGNIVYVTGSTSSLDFPTSNPYQTHQVADDAFVTALSISGDSLVYSTYLGGNLYDYGYGIAVDASGNAYVTGSTQSSDFPTWIPHQAIYQGGANGRLGGDVIVTKLTYGLGDLSFRPDPDGWQFGNTADNMWPESWWQQFDYSRPQYPLSWRWLCSPSDFPDWHLWVRTFGVDQCYFSFPPGPLTYKPSAVARWLDSKQVWGGSCVGFAISSLLLFDGFLDVATEFPGNAEVYQVPIGDESRLMVNMYWTYIFGEARRAHVNANWNTTTPTQTLQACLDMFYSVTRDDRALYMHNNNGDGGHVVVPYRSAVDPLDPDVTHIYIYDNNVPSNVNARVSINTLTDTWSYDAKPTWGGAKWLFLLDPISNYTTNPVMSRSTVLADKRMSGATRSVSQYAEFYLPSTGDVVFRFSSDSIGYIDGSFLSNLTDGMPIIPITGQETPPIGYYLPNHPWSIRLSGFTDSTLRLTAYLDSAVIAYSRTDVDSTQIDELQYRGNDSSIVVLNPDIVNHVYGLQVISIHPDSEVVVKIAGLASEAGDSNYFSITSESGLRIDNYGAPSQYSIRVEIASPATDTVFFHDGVTIGGNSSHIILPDWRQSSDLLIVEVDSGIDGSIDDTLFLFNNVSTDIDEQGSTGQLPYRFELAQNYPNPFNPATTIEYSVPTQSHVKIEIFNVLGQKVRTLVDQSRSAGSYRIEWAGTDDAGRSVSTGVYFYRIRAGEAVQTKKMLMLR